MKCFLLPHRNPRDVQQSAKEADTKWSLSGTRRFFLSGRWILALLLCAFAALSGGCGFGDDWPDDHLLSVPKQYLLAMLGDPDAQFILGTMYDRGEGVTQDAENAAWWFLRAARQEHEEAQFIMGMKSYLGAGVRQDMNEAANWFRAAAENGSANASLFLSGMYSSGETGFPADKKMAHYWCQRAAEQGDTDAQFISGMVHFKGEDKPKNIHEAVKWFRRSAEQGNADSQFYLGFMYDTGDGVPKNRHHAIRWFRKAAEQGHADAQFYLGVAYHTLYQEKKERTYFTEAKYWLSSAKDQGVRAAQSYLDNLKAMHPKGD